MDKQDVVTIIENVLRDKEIQNGIWSDKISLLEMFKYLRETWNTDNDQTFEEWQEGLSPYSLSDLDEGE